MRLRVHPNGVSRRIGHLRWPELRNACSVQPVEKAKVLIDFRVKRIPAACRSFAPKGGTLGALLVQRRPCDSRLFAYQLWLRSFGAGETDDRMSSTPGLSRKGEEPPLGKNPLDEGVHIDASKSL